MAVYTVIIHRLQKYILICTPPTVLRKKLLFTLQKVSFWNAKSSFSWGEKLLFVGMVVADLQLAEYAAVATGLYVVEPFAVVAYPTVGARLHAF